jgi:hypothetical protein
MGPADPTKRRIKMTINAGEVKLTIMEVANLTASLTGDPAKRSADKASAIRAFNAALTGRIGEKGAAASASDVLLEDEFVFAKKSLENVVEAASGNNGSNLVQEATAEQVSTASLVDQIDTPPAPALDDYQPNAAEKQGQGRRGRKPTGLGKRFFALCTVNVRREGSFGHTSLQIIMDNPGITGDEFLAKGGRLKDLRFDLQQQRVRLEG